MEPSQQIVSSNCLVLDGCGGLYYRAAKLYRPDFEFIPYRSEATMAFDMDRLTDKLLEKKMAAPYAVISNLNLVIESALEVIDEVVVNDEIISIKGANEENIAYYVHYDLKLDQFYKRQLCTTENELALWMRDKATGLITCRSFLPEGFEEKINHERFISKKFYICKV